MKKDFGLGEDPLDAFLSRPKSSPLNSPQQNDAEQQETTSPEDVKGVAQDGAPSPAVVLEPGPKVTVTFHLSFNLIERLRNAAFYMPGLTASGIIESALAKELELLDQEHEERYGKRIPKRTAQLRPGRPPKS
jgi:hypothetical protein